VLTTYFIEILLNILRCFECCNKTTLLRWPCRNSVTHWIIRIILSIKEKIVLAIYFVSDCSLVVEHLIEVILRHRILLTIRFHFKLLFYSHFIFIISFWSYSVSFNQELKLNIMVSPYTDFLITNHKQKDSSYSPLVQPNKFKL
jgi:hypothetical protein